MDRRQFLKGSAIVGVTLASPILLKTGSGMAASPSCRKIYRILNAERTTVGTLPILRAFAGDQDDYVSPYVLFDEFGPVTLKAGSRPLRVDAHPHAGFIPTTFFLEGSGHHKDSLNFDFQVGKGDFMMFSAGRGAIHMEETGKKLHEAGGNYHGFQIWLNTPGKHKFIDPSTHVYGDKKMGTLIHRDYTARVVLGALKGVKSAIETFSPAFYFHIRMRPNCRLDIPTDPSHNAFMYVISGQVELTEQKQVRQNQIVLYQRGESAVNLYAKDGAEILLLGGKPLNEPVFAYGPFVMNTESQIRQCIADYQSGKMGNPDLVNL